MLRLREDSLDVGFVRLPLASGADMEVVHLGRERMIVALRRSHPLAAKKLSHLSH
jgi:DNA-binding transcriptional LysR family regulator